MDETLLEIYKQHAQHRTRYIYFLLTSAGACIGFSMTQTRELALAWPNHPLIIALFLWGVSIFAGLRSLQATEKVIFANFQMLKIQMETGAIHELARITDQETIKPLNRRLVFWERIQLTTLLFGAVALVAWKIASAYPSIAELLGVFGSTFS